MTHDVVVVGGQPAALRNENRSEAQLVDLLRAHAHTHTHTHDAYASCMPHNALLVGGQPAAHIAAGSGARNEDAFFLVPRTGTGGRRCWDAWRRNRNEHTHTHMAHTAWPRCKA